MATVVARLEAILYANTHNFDRAMDRSEGRMHSAGKAAGRAGLAIAGGLAFGLERSVHAALEAQTSQARLAQAFANAHLNALKYEPQIKKLEASSRKLGFTEEDVHTSLGSLITSTGSYAAAAKQMALAQDLARFKSVGLEQATKALTMAHAGSLRPLKQLGLDVAKVTTAQDKLKAAVKDHTTATYANALAQAKLQDKSATFAKVLEVTTGAVHGQADAYSKTAAGSMEQFKAQLNFLEISMGQGLLPILAKVANAVSKASAYFAEHHKQAKLLTIALGFLTGALIAARAAQLLLNLAVLANPYVAAIAAVVAAGIAIYVFRDKLKNVYEWIKAHYPLLAGIIAGPIGLAVAEIIKHRDAIANAFTSLPGMIGDAIGGAMHFLKKKLGEIFDWHRIVGWIKDALGFGSPSPYFMAIGTDMVHSMAKGVGDAAGVLKDAVFHLAGQYASFQLPGASLPPGQHARRGPGGPGGPRSGAAEGSAFHVGRQLWDEIGMGEKLGLRVTSGYRAGAVTKHGTKSDHSYYPSRAVDMAGAASGMAGLFRELVGRREIRQAFYDPLGSIFNGVWSSYREGGHSDHIHMAEYDRGGWLPPGLSLALNRTGRPERVGGGDTVIVQVGPEEIARVVFDQIRGKAQVFMNRNGRPAFEGG